VSAISPANFAHSLARYMVDRASSFRPPVVLRYAEADIPRDLYRNRAIEGEHTTDALYSVLRQTGGPNTYRYPQARFSFQVHTVATVTDDGLDRAQALFETLCDGLGQPLRMTEIAAYRAADDGVEGLYRIVAVDFLNRPGLVGVDERGRANVSFNFDVGFYRL
jgi:hypothetical protein